MENDLRTLQTLVGGYIEYCQDPLLGYSVLCDEEAAIKGLRPTLLPTQGTYAGRPLRGNCLIIGCDRNSTDFVSVPPHVIDSFDTLFDVL